jgi:AIG2-like family
MIFASDAIWLFAMTNIIYFAYGSNMLTPRLRYRVPSSVLLSTASLPQHQLRFHKRSMDGSGKCNAFHTGNLSDAVYGALFEIPPLEKRKLDRAEGLGSGYHEQSVQIVLPNGKQIIAEIYIADATHIDENLRPYFWYKEFVARGAEEHLLPQEYINRYINTVPGVADPDAARENARRAGLRAELKMLDD